MFRTQIQIKDEQARALKKLATKEGKSVAELIRISVDALLQSSGVKDQEELRRKARLAAGRLNGPSDLAANHDRLLGEAFDR